MIDTTSNGHPLDAFGAPSGEMAERIRLFDWAATPLGPADSWSPTLRTMIRIMLANRFPHILWWGPSYIQFYNDAYRPIPGTKHPERALGRPAGECWPEIWHVIKPLIDRPFHGGPATWDDDIFLEVNRHGFREESHFTIAYSPVPDDTVPSGIGGVLATVHEITEKVVGERRVNMLRDLGARVADAKTAEDACAMAAETFAAYAKDVPFVLLYLIDPGSNHARLAGAAGVEAGKDISPELVNLDALRQDGWPLLQALRDGALLVTNFGDKFLAVPSGPWDDPPNSAIVTAIPSNLGGKPAGFMVAGVSARLKWDQRYRDFLDLAKAQVATAIANARAYEEEKRRAETLAELDRAKTTFFSNVSHEFRTPLTLMLGPVEDLLARRPDELSSAAKHDLTLVERNGLRLLRLVNSLLDFSRIEAGRMEATYEPTDLARFTEDLASLFRSACEHAGLSLTVDCETLAEPVFVDRGMWEKIVLNLLSNAFKFTLAGGITVSLRAVGDKAELQVADTGTGIPADELPHVFERFHRVQGTNGRTHEGTGIGLALTMELVRLHGGCVHVESKLGGGSTFIVDVPMGMSHQPPNRIERSDNAANSSTDPRPFVDEALGWLPDDPTAVRHPSPAAPTLAGQPHTRLFHERSADHPCILVADDNADMRQYLARILEKHYEVELAADGQAALERIRQRRPELVLTDVMMPVLDGFGLLRALRTNTQTAHLPVIMLSARAGEESLSEGVEAGADDYLIKPFSARELLARVGTHLKMARFRREALDTLSQRSMQFKTLLDQAPLGVYVVDADLVIREANPTALKAIGDIAGGVIGRGFDQVIHLLWKKEQADSIVRIFRHTLDTGEPYVAREWAENRLDRGVTEYYEWKLDRIPLPDGRNGVVCYFRDISDHVNSRKRIEASEEALREADRRKDEFLNILAHELRGPLATISNTAHILGQSNAESHLAHQALDRQLSHLVRLVDDLLDTNRITRGQLRLHIERVELQTVIRDAIETCRPLAQKLGRAVTLDIPRESIWLNADPVRLSQIFSNLISNAYKYTEDGGHVWLSAEQRGENVLVRVKDDGIGIPAEALSSVFDLFMQVHTSRDRSRGGLGIGLALVKQLIEMHGGQVEVFSDGPLRGSEFVVHLPLPSGASVVNSVRPAPPAEAVAIASLQVLVVDDDRDSAWSLAELLNSCGHQTRTAHDGFEAIAAAEEYRPDVILMDIGLPTISGHEAGRQIRSQPWGTNIMLIAVSGWAQEEDRRRSREAGFDAHLVKPVDIGVLMNLLQSLEELHPGSGRGRTTSSRG
ncbi:ATP-binding protein [Cupriavidus sp. CV2]|uniref:ATP-binding protein n=1 Tax=Cupriavidus ulmosensis TaxID=3065913 RepID=UPI00296B4ED7|nr:ATP-binding protein [Cupriavidus sp. CV2]MDW3688447.1 ATP-binding protein [Cupriavidus sp. CV2]